MRVSLPSSSRRVSSSSARCWLASHSLMIDEPCCRMASVSPFGSQSSWRHLPEPSRAMVPTVSPWRLKMLTIRLLPQVARNAPAGCHLKSTVPFPWYDASMSKRFFCAGRGQWEEACGGRRGTAGRDKRTGQEGGATRVSGRAQSGGAEMSGRGRDTRCPTIILRLGSGRSRLSFCATPIPHRTADEALPPCVVRRCVKVCTQSAGRLFQQHRGRSNPAHWLRLPPTSTRLCSRSSSCWRSSPFRRTHAS